MKQCIPLSAMLLVLSASGAAAEPIVFGTAEVTTSGVFGCKAAPACTTSGSSVVLGSGDSAVTLTFTPVTTSVSISNEAVPVTLGTLSATSNSATFPTRTNPNVAIVTFSLVLTQTAPVPDVDVLGMQFGPGGGTALGFLMGNTYFTLNPGPVPAGYGRMVYSLAPFKFSIPMNGSVDITANAGVVPEPGTLALVGLGLAGAARRRKQAITGQ